MSLWMKFYGVTIQMKATEQFFPVVLFIISYKVVLTILYVNEILWCDHSNETSLLFSHGAVFFSAFSIMRFRPIVMILNNEMLKTNCEGSLGQELS